MNYKWTWQCDNYSFDTKTAAALHANQHNQYVNFVCPDFFNEIEFHKEPKESWNQLMLERALEIRESNSKINLWFSGGCDSERILRTYIENRIHLDEITCFKCGIPPADFEIDQYAIPYLNKIKHLIPKTKINIVDIDFAEYKNYYSNPNWVNDIWSASGVLIRLIEDVEQKLMLNTPESTVNILGNDKPMVVYVNGQWYTYFLDAVINPIPGHGEKSVDFYLGCPKLNVKQSHLLKNYLEQNYVQEQYFTVAKINALCSQDVVNYASGRIDAIDEHYLEKLYTQAAKENYFVGGVKDQIALDYILNKDREIADLFKKGTDTILEMYGAAQFNQGRPEYGLIGSLSPFFCLDRAQSKTADQLFPKGFK